MRTRMKKTLLALLAALGLLLAGAACADQPLERTFYVSLSAQEDGGDMPGDAVMWQRIGSKYYLFLPGAEDLVHARVWFGTGTEIVLNGETLKNGDRVSTLREGEAVRLRYMGKSFQLNIMQGSPIAAVFINTASGVMTNIDKSKSHKEPRSLTLLNGAGVCEYDGALDHVKLRGHTSAKFDKKSYTIKLHQKTNLLGMGKAKKWVLTGNARDHALIRNQICFEMAAYVGLPYTPDCRPVDLYLNHMYNGTYLLQEKLEIGENRVDIMDLEAATEAVNSEPLSAYPKAGMASPIKGQFKYIDIPNDPEDITGGYLFEFESATSRYEEADCVYDTARSQLIVVKEPEYASKAQMAFISRMMQGFENAIFAADGVDRVSGKSYREFVDFDSLVLKYMLEEISKNLDGSRSSQFFYKPSDTVSTVAFAGPAWDYDSTFGDYARERDSKDLINPTGFYHTTRTQLNYWWPRLYAKPDFKDGVHAMWRQRYAPAIRILLGREADETGRLQSIETYASVIEKSAAMNFTLWPMRQSSENIARCGKTFRANIEYLTGFISKRYDFLESKWGSQEE